MTSNKCVCIESRGKTILKGKEEEGDKSVELVKPVLVILLCSLLQ